MSKEDTIKTRLEAKKTELKRYQRDFLVLTEIEIDTSQYERNAISNLMVMMQLKAEIEELELILKLK